MKQEKQKGEGRALEGGRAVLDVVTEGVLKQEQVGRRSQY